MSDAARRTATGIVVVCAVIAAAAWLRHQRVVSLASEESNPAEADGPGLSDSAPPKRDPAVPAIAPTDPHPLPRVLIDPEVRVDKGRRRLTVVSDGLAVKHYRIALGSAPAGHKHREGDNRTPEGTYFICSKNIASKYHRALGLSYPNEDDADAALADGLITPRDHRAIVGALHKMAQPPWKTPLGGEIMIHGGGSGRGDWTQGCIALDDADAEELFTALPMGATVTIRP